MFKFLTRRPLWQNVLVGFILSVSVFIGFFLMLNSITNHGEYLVIPDVNGKNFKSIKIELERKGFDVMIQDSIYVDSLPPNIVLKQYPEPDATVKVNRTIYLTVNCSVPPMINMPNLVGMTFRNAILQLKQVGLKIGDTSYVVDTIGIGIRDQLYNSVSLKPGSQIRMGTPIDLVIGVPMTENGVNVPDLFALTYIEAQMVIELNGLTTGLVTLDENLSDTALGYVYWQSPLPLNELKSPNKLKTGQPVSLKLSLEMPLNRIDSIN